MTDDQVAPSSEAEQLSLAPGNRLLARLQPGDLALLRPGLERVVLSPHEVLFRPGDSVEFVYFPERDTVIGLFMPMADGRVALSAAASFGSAVGISDAMGDGRSSARAVTLMAGPMLRVPAALFTAAFRKSAAIETMVARYTQALLGQAMQNAACNSLHTIEQRVARWIITAHDVAEEGAQAHPSGAVPLPLTQEMLADILGVQRTSVTVAAGHLRAAGLVRYQRRYIFIADRPRLERAACECHTSIRQMYRRMLVNPAGN